ncbi:MAG TPA: DoxX family protein [Opitutales bacterium]|nr:DoxX family protein [Opitutales bacterium]
MEAPAINLPPDAPRWRWPTRVAFRFCFVYFGLVIFPFPLGYVPYSDYLFYYIYQAYDAFWNWLVPWTGAHILHLSKPITILPNGSGDTTWNYVQVFCLVVIAGVSTAIWSWLDRRRPAYPKLYQWSRLLVRLYLAAVLISYGLDKVVPLQMPRPSLLELSTPLGDIPPGGLLWAFIGASPAFEIFTGLVEVAGGLLLILPRTAPLGALVGAASLFFIFMLNLCYDVPVKLYSFFLLGLSLFLLAPELGRLARLFLLGERVELTKPVPLFSRRWLNALALVLQVAFGLTQFHNNLGGDVDNAKSFGFLAPESPWYGVWSVEKFTRDGQVVPPNPDDETCWSQVIFDKPGRVNVRAGRHARISYEVLLSRNGKVLQLRTGKNASGLFTCAPTGGEHLTLTGDLEGHHYEIQLQRQDENKYILPTRGFHWINEYPYF